VTVDTARQRVFAITLDRITADGGFELRSYARTATTAACRTIDKARFDEMSRYFARKLDYLIGRCRIWGVMFDRSLPGIVWSLECRLVADKPRASGRQRPAGRTGFGALVSRVCIHARLPLSNRIIRAA